MMKFLKKFPLAVSLTLLIVVGCVGYSFLNAPAPLPKVTFGDWVCDEADVLSSEMEQLVREKNSALDGQYGSVVAVLTVDSEKGWDSEEFAREVFEDWGLGSADFLAVFDVGTMDYLYYGDAYDDFDVESILVSGVDPYFFNGEYEEAVKGLFSGITDYFEATGASYDPESAPYWDTANPDSYGAYDEFYTNASQGVSLLGILILIILILVILNALDRARYNTWYRTYGYMSSPPRPFVPILFWHRPGGAWWNRRRPPRGPGPGPGPGPGFGPRPGNGPGFGPKPGSGPKPGPGPGFGPKPGSGPKPGPGSGFGPKPGGSSRPGGSFGGGGRSSRSGGFGGGGSSRGGGFGGGGRGRR